MKFSEVFTGVVELAKAGYKPEDVKGLLELCKTDPGESNEPKEPEPNEPKEPKEPEPNEPKEPEPNAFEKLVNGSN